MKMRFDNPPLMRIDNPPKFEGHSSIFSNFRENVLMWLLLVGLTSALEETDFVLQDEHVSKPALLELFLIQLVFLTSME